MKVLSILLFFSLKLYSQDIDHLKSQDTLYLVLEESDKDLIIKDSDITYRVYGTGFMNTYQFTQDDRRSIIFETFHTGHISGKSNLEVKRKDFFKKNIDKIIDFAFIKKLGLSLSFIDILVSTKRKTVYVIDSKKLKRRKITLKKTYIIDGLFMGS